VVNRMVYGLTQPNPYMVNKIALPPLVDFTGLLSKTEHW
jgi:hypothetical protein